MAGPTVITRTLPAGGLITVDASIKRTHKKSNTITQFPVEVGIDISDHIRPKPPMLTIEGVVSDLRPSGQPGQVANAHAFLKDLFEDNPGLVSISTRFQNYVNMGPLDLDIPDEAPLGGVLKFTAQFQFMRFGTTATSTVNAKLGNGTSKGKLEPIPLPIAPAGTAAANLRNNLMGAAAQAAQVQALALQGRQWDAALFK